MCGIYGQVGKLKDEQLAFLKKQLQHRGPDDQQCKEIDELSLFHARLSIVAISEGQQPMCLGPYVIVFNGEIYNHLELRTQFSIHCKTGSDTETLLHLYEKLGKDMLPYLDGMFSFAIYNKQTKILFLARDKIGEKPLYIYRKGTAFAFASELNTLAGLFDVTINATAIGELLKKGWNSSSNAIYNEVTELKLGSYMLAHISTQEQVVIQKEQTWWDAMTQMENKEKLSFADAVQKTEMLLHRSVKRRIESSDVPVGCFLSGGIDSGIIAAVAAHYNNKLHTYTVAFEGTYDERGTAAQVAAHIGTHHNSIELNYRHLQDDISKILPAYGEPFCDDSAIPTWYVAREAGKHLKVVLNGDGGDELFGGYRRYRVAAFHPFIKKSFEVLSPLHTLLPYPKNKMNLYSYLHRLLCLSHEPQVERYLAGTTELFYSTKTGAVRFTNEQEYERLSAILTTNGFSDLGKMLLADRTGILPQLLLKKVDIATMQHSLESRTVFFEPELLALAFALPEEYAINGAKTKPVLRALAAQLLPQGISNLPKRGFEMPLQNLVNTQLHNIIKDYLLAPGLKLSEWIGPKVVTQLVADKIKGVSAERRAKMIYTLFVIEYWLQNRKQYLEELKRA